MGQRIGTPHQLRHAIGQGLPPLLWISGDELLLVIEAADLVRAQARKQGFDEREVVDIDARFDRRRLIEATQSTSLFASRRLIDLRLNVKPTKELGEALRDLLPRLDDDTRIMVSSQHLEKTTTSTAWFEALARQMLWMETPRIDVASLGKWIAERLADCRAGKTTIVATVSPLVLGRCDEVVFLVDGKEALRGTHHELSSHPDYRAVVHRGESDEGGKAPAAPEARGEGARDVGGEKVGVDGKGGVGLGKADVDRENGGAK